jgi:hypothetical protein
VLLFTALFLATLFCCHGSILPSIFHGVQRRIVAIVECIESMKNYVKRKIGTRRYDGAMTFKREAAPDARNDRKNKSAEPLEASSRKVR